MNVKYIINIFKLFSVRNFSIFKNSRRNCRYCIEVIWRYHHTKEFEAYRREDGFRVYACRGSDPESKGKIDNVIGFIKNNFAKHRVNTNLDDWNEQGRLWLERRGNGKVHSTTKNRS